jgi:anthranilate synthase component 1
VFRPVNIQDEASKKEAPHGGNDVNRIEVDYAVDPFCLHARLPARYPFLLQSTATGTPRSRFDILFAFPEEAMVLSAEGVLSGAEAPSGGGNFLDALDDWYEKEGTPGDPEEGLPFSGGWFIYLSYELAGQIEPTVGMADIDEPWPLAVAVRVPAALVRDHEQKRAFAVAESRCRGHLGAIAEDFKACDEKALRKTLPAAAETMATLREESGADFLEGVKRIKRYIREGDVFQVNLSRAWRGRLRSGADAVGVYQRLRQANPAPFAGIARFGPLSILSSSPERLYSVRGGLVETRPIAGTHPRNADAAADRALSAALLVHPKERAEHIMLIDLERNDLGRVCETGSVEVNELMALESYTHVHHIVSNVRGRLRAGTTPGQVIRAAFPGGTITGCPKVRCMEIIRELEGVRRGPYTGAFGYLDRSGDADFNILIRSIAIQEQQVVLRAGAGIVADSIPERELHETRQKARGPLGSLIGQAT